MAKFEFVEMPRSWRHSLWRDAAEGRGYSFRKWVQLILCTGECAFRDSKRLVCKASNRQDGTGSTMESIPSRQNSSGAQTRLSNKFNCAEEDVSHSIRKACTGSIDAARRAGMMLAMAAASTSTPIATLMTGTLTLVMS